MTSPRTERLKRLFPYALLIVLGALVFLSSFQKQRWDTDIFWALSTGSWIINSGEVPSVDPFSYTFEGKPWIDFTWGFQVVSYAFYSGLGGFYGLFILQLAVTSAVFIALYHALKNATGGRLHLVAALMLLVFAASSPRLFIRPHLFAYLFITLYLLVLSRNEKAPGWKITALLPLQVLWVNIHSSAVLGIFLAGAFSAGSVIDGLRERGLRPRGVFTPDVSRLVFVTAMLPIASLVNPYGLRLVLFPFVHQSVDNYDALRHIGEWIRLPLNELIFYLYPYPLNQFAFKALLIGAVIALILNRRSLKSRDIIILAGAFYMASTHMRWLAKSAFLSAPLVASNLSAYLVALEKSFGDRLKGRSDAIFSAVAVFTAGFLLYNYLNAGARDNYGVGIKRGAYPEGTVSFMKAEGIKGRVFNEYIFGGYITHEYPELKVFIDGRTPTVYSPHFFWTSRLVNDPVMWGKLVNEHSIDMALIKPDTKHCDDLRKGAGWKAVAFDDVSVLFLRVTDYFRDAISRHGLENVNPCSTGVKYDMPADKASLEALRDELERMVAGPLGESARPRRLLGLVYAELGGEYLEKAVKEYERALAVKKDAYTLYDLGVTLGKLKRHGEAIEALRAAVCRDKGFKEAWLALGLVYYDSKDYGKAIKALKKYAFLADDTASLLGYSTLGKACFETGDFECSAVYLKRAAYLSDKSEERADLYYRIGNSLFESGDLAGGIEYYGRAIDEKAEYAYVIAELSRELKGLGRTEKAEKLSELISSRGNTTLR